MAKCENLPAKLSSQTLVVLTEKRGSLVARGIAALRTVNDVRYRQAREVYNQLTDDGLASWYGYEERILPLTVTLKSFKALASEGFGKAYFPLSTLYGGEQSIKGDAVQAERYRKLSFDWLHANEHLNDPEIWRDLGVLYVGNDVNLSIHWFQKAAEVGDASSM